VTTPLTPNPQNSDRRVVRPGQTRGRLHLIWDVVFGSLRFIGHYARNAYTVFGIFLLSGTVIAVLFTWAFAEVAQKGTRGLDSGVRRRRHALDGSAPVQGCANSDARSHVARHRGP
jgi:hypothetical protein